MCIYIYIYIYKACRKNNQIFCKFSSVWQQHIHTPSPSSEVQSDRTRKQIRISQILKLKSWQVYIRNIHIYPHTHIQTYIHTYTLQVHPLCGAKHTPFENYVEMFMEQTNPFNISHNIFHNCLWSEHPFICHLTNK